MTPVELLAQLPPGLRVLAILAVAVVVGLVAHALLYRGLTRLGSRAPAMLVLDGALLRRTRPPARVLLPLLAVHSALPLLRASMSRDAEEAAERVLHVLLVAAVAWVLLALTRVLDDVVERRFDIGVADNLRARRVRTRVGLLRRVLVVAIVVLALGAMLMRFQGFRAVGAGLIASAGVVGIIVSIAAQRPLANIVAGVQLALTQPIRVGDAVVIENEWGTVEEINLTYVVVRIWDQRRLVLPISHFFEKPFQNWTRTSTQVIGSVFLYVDYTAPVAAIRSAFEQVVRSSPHWDGQVAQLQVSDATDRSLQLRAIMSAANAGAAWDLRCDVRERLVDWLQREHPATLPTVRVSDQRSAVSDQGAPSLEPIPRGLQGPREGQV
ncbi:MAG: mechanosensitive ion channel family protein [Gemmatirosa sp.]